MTHQLVRFWLNRVAFWNMLFIAVLTVTAGEGAVPGHVPVPPIGVIPFRPTHPVYHASSLVGLF